MRIRVFDAYWAKRDYVPFLREVLMRVLVCWTVFKEDWDIMMCCRRALSRRGVNDTFDW